MASGRKEKMAPGFYPPIQREVMIVSDYEFLVVIIMIITLAFTVHNGTHK